MGVKFLQRMFSKIAIRIEGGSARLRKGKIRSAGLRDAAAICDRAGVRDGEVWLDGRDRVSFSDEIPAELRQQLRNCLLDAVQG